MAQKTTGFTVLQMKYDPFLVYLVLIPKDLKETDLGNLNHGIIQILKL